jgi:hypothetical protein
LPDKEELIRREEGRDDIWVNFKVRKSIQKCIKVLEKQQAKIKISAKKAKKTQKTKE